MSNSFKKRLQGVGRARSNGCAGTGPTISHSLFRLKFAILGHFWPSWSSSFFHNFSNTLFYRFWPHLGSQNGSKILPKSIQNRSKNLIEKLSTFGVDFSSIFDRFWTQLNFKKHQKRCEGCQFLCFRYLYFKIDPNMFLTSFLHRFFFHFGSQIPPKNLSKKKSNFESIFHRFLSDFGLHLGSNFSQNRLKRGLDGQLGAKMGQLGSKMLPRPPFSSIFRPPGTDF